MIHKQCTISSFLTTSPSPLLQLEDDLGPLNEGAKNEKMSDSPWIFKLNIADSAELDGLMEEEKYVEMVKELEDE